MAWEAVTKAECAALAGCSEDDIIDEWYDYVVGYIAKYGNHWHPADPTPVTELRNGSGALRTHVSKPPVYSVESVTIDGSEIPAEYVAFDSAGIYLITRSYQTIPNYKFSRGVKNVELSYVSGTAEATGDVRMAIALMIKELVNQSTAEGANSRILMFKPNRADAIADPLVEWGIHGKLMGIVNDLVGKRKLGK